MTGITLVLAAGPAQPKVRWLNWIPSPPRHATAAKDMETLVKISEVQMTRMTPARGGCQLLQKSSLANTSNRSPQLDIPAQRYGLSGLFRFRRSPRLLGNLQTPTVHIPLLVRGLEWCPALVRRATSVCIRKRIPRRRPVLCRLFFLIWSDDIDMDPLPIR
ncbi:hypothetical protein B0H63DRAFT_458293 [Podospora didyma]|uniref:Uncharacterized protein n=1 Tax=Podospora didyma TaxID=330526 RepID=A0AAE0P550_9PEZI|nr:hypothetical protein B0H63DRAFT_458293 [Podospora didyma]